MKVLLVGASGFVGSELVNEFLQADFDLYAVAGPRTKKRSNFSQSVEFEFADITDPEDVAKLESIGNVDVVVHTAGIAHRFEMISDAEFHEVNVTGVENIANLAVKLRARHFVLFSSSLVYGQLLLSKVSDVKVIDEDAECKPLDAYGSSKLNGESAARIICEANDIHLTIFRPAPIIGEGSKGNFSRLIRAIDRRHFVWVGNGKNRKSLIYVGDVAKAVVRVIDKGGSGTQIFNLSAGELEMRQIVGAIEDELGRKNLPLALPANLLKTAIGIASRFIFKEKLARLSATLDTWLSDTVLSNVKFRSAYEFVPQTNIEQAIRLETRYYLDKK